MEATFAIVIFVVAGLAIAFAVWTLGGWSDNWGQIGKGGLSLDEPDLIPGPAAGSPAAHAEAEEEVRQMLQAKSDRRVSKGGAPLDIDAEVLTLMGPSTGSRAADDAGIREEVRQLVEARNHRRAKKGEEPLDVDAEVQALLRPAPSADPELREEVRQLVIARNERRGRRGEDPLDVEAEVDRQMRDLGA